MGRTSGRNTQLAVFPLARADVRGLDGIQQVSETIQLFLLGAPLEIIAPTPNRNVARILVGGGAWLGVERLIEHQEAARTDAYMQSIITLAGLEDIADFPDGI